MRQKVFSLHSLINDVTDDSFELFQYNYFYVSSSTFDVNFDDESDKHAREQCVLNKSFSPKELVCSSENYRCTALHGSSPVAETLWGAGNCTGGHMGSAYTLCAQWNCDV